MQPPNLTIPEALQQAVDHHKDGRLQNAEQLYRAILQTQPKHTDANHNLGVLAVQMNMVEQALPFFRIAIETNPTNSQYWLSYIDALIKLSKHDDARQVLKQGQEKGLSGKRVDQLSTQLKENNAPPQDQIAALINMYHSGQMTKTEQACHELLQTYPHTLVILNVLGGSFNGQGKFQEAIESYNKAIQIKPDYAEAYSNRGIALKELGELEEAVESCNKAIQIKPDYAEAYYNRGIALKDLGQLEEAIESYNKAIQIKPDCADTYNNRGIALKEIGQLREAVESYNKAIQIKPDCAGAYYNRGNALKDLGRLKEAVNSFQQSLQLDPNDFSSQHMINSIIGEDSNIAPRVYVEKLFNHYASNFEHSLVNKLEYKMPSLLNKTLVDQGLSRKFDKAIDLGCGTGLAGVEFRDLVGTLIGVDLSDNMILKADEKNIYDKLYVDDLISGIQKAETNFDLFISSDVLVYLGDLRPLFGCIEKHANNNALFIFSTEDVDGDNFCLRDTGRFAHSKEYVLSVATDCSFEVEFFERSNLRKDKGEWIVGGIYILKRV